MRIIIFLSLLMALASPAFAEQSGDAAFEILAKYSAEKRQNNFTKLKTSISQLEAHAIDEEMSELYGLPTIKRGGLKVWEVKNSSGSGAEHTTIMCGPDGKGGFLISADRRGPKAIGANTKSTRGNREHASRKKLKRDQRVKRSTSIQQSQERD